MVWILPTWSLEKQVNERIERVTHDYTVDLIISELKHRYPNVEHVITCSDLKKGVLYIVRGKVGDSFFKSLSIVNTNNVPMNPERWLEDNGYLKYRVMGEYFIFSVGDDNG